MAETAEVAHDRNTLASNTVLGFGLLEALQLIARVF